jgi:hypothetical protein
VLALWQVHRAGPQSVQRPGKRSLGRLYANYTAEELEVILDFLTRSTERLRNETVKLTRLEARR